MDTIVIKQKLTELITPGLVYGLGKPVAGQLCVEAAICLAMGEPHTDRPPCVAEADCRYAIRINDARWSSNQVRGAALLPLALAQLGTTGTDRGPWVKRVCEGGIRKILPLALREAARVNPKFGADLEAAAVRCETEGTKESARAANLIGRKAASAASAADRVLKAAVQIALDAYAAEGRFP